MLSNRSGVVVREVGEQVVDDVLRSTLNGKTTPRRKSRSSGPRDRHDRRFSSAVVACVPFDEGWDG
ncbi:hypothetical protein [Saccharothrix sp. NRRL B-16314]|uniref:hypothetical protein n=1 Tax=Saccharothrix sp. NRRL B-16314 TaxID=1463825 RepID=UPI0005268256|nr:hypothetical protein [Saccharothrix sp. NRRL B-16314]